MEVFGKLVIPWLIFILYLQLGNINSLSDNVRVSSAQLKSPKFSHLMIHQNTVFIGAGDRLFKLPRELNVLSNVSTTWNYEIKNMFINPKNSELIACGGSRSYWCSSYNFHEDTKGSQRNNETLISDERGTCTNAPVVSFIEIDDTAKNNADISNLCFANSYCNDSSEVSPLFVVKISNTHASNPNSTTNSENNFFMKYRNDHKVIYKYGFTSGKYYYILTTQRNSTSGSSYVSKLIRICYNGESLRQGYTEIPIECKSESNQVYNLLQAAHVGKPSSQLAKSLNIKSNEDVLFGVFSKSQNKESFFDKPSNESALCIYSLKAINEKFIENIRNFSKGNGYHGFSTSPPHHQSTKSNQNIDSRFCSSDVNMPLIGTISVTESSVYSFQTVSTVPTSIATKPNEKYHDVFIGFSNGRLKKIAVNNLTDVCVDADLPIEDGSPVNSDLIFSPSKDYLYAMTEHTLIGLRTPQNSICSDYIDFNTCFNSAPHYCGWCGFTNKCTNKCDCSYKNFALWHASDFRKQFKIMSSSSQEFQIGTVGNIQLNISNPPPICDQFLCHFLRADGQKLSTSGKLNRGSLLNILSCEMPDIPDISKLLENGHFLNATLRISTLHIPDIAQVNVIFFDCQTYTSYNECVSSSFKKCDWSPKEEKCIYNEKTIPDKKTSQIISIPSGMHSVLNFTDVSLNFCDEDSNLECFINIEGKTHPAKPKMKNFNSMSCEGVSFTYEKNSPNTVANVTIMRKTSTSSHILLQTNFTIYKCQEMAHDCSKCLLLNASYECGWCRNTNSCEFRANCDNKFWHRDNICEKSFSPLILTFQPLKSPVGGRTNVTIIGENLGFKFEDINQNITVAGFACKPFREKYIETELITCVIENTNLLEDHEGPVQVNVNGKYVRSRQNFKFVVSKIERIFPDSGPTYGGTVLNIIGKNLDAGNSITVVIGDSPCLIISLNSSTIQCITNASRAENTTKIFIKYDNNFRNLTSDSFKYEKDKKRDENGYNIDPKGIRSGGVEILLRNVTQQSFQQLWFYVHGEKQNYSGQCKIKTGSNPMWSCLSPFISDIGSDSIDVNDPRIMNVSLKGIDITKGTTFFDSGDQSLKFSLYPDPKFKYFFNTSVKFNGNNFLIIAGENINKACQKTDIHVKVGNYSCEVRSISSTQVICILPKYPSANVTIESDVDYDFLKKYDTISVSIGANFTVVVPKQRGPDFTTEDLYADYKIYYAIMIVIIIITAILVVSLCIFERKMLADAMKKLRKTQEQIAKLELRAASKSEESIPELQSHATAFMADDNTFLPFLSHHAYMMNILFPNINDHSIILNEATILNYKAEGLQSFRELIMNRKFLLTFVRTLEKEESFTMNDRVFVAAMIMITLQKDMGYCTSILKTLLAELIEKYVRSNSHPKLYFRITESVAEKMLSAWFSFLLYKFLKESAGPPLFNLFNAIKQHVNEGPIDMITSQAWCCLSENKLLRHVFKYFAITIYVNISQQTAQIMELESAIEEVPVKVLDCDTISQFKEKALDAVYRAINHSRVLNPSELNVEWIYDTSSRLILSDDDSSSIIEGEWRQKNTLRHYGIPDGSILNLISYKETSHHASGVIPVSNNKESQNNISHMHTSSLHVTGKNSSTESTTAPILGNDLHYKEWHLIKPQNQHDFQEEHGESDQIIQEVYLLRLLDTKNSLQNFVDELFNVIFKKTNQNGCFPIAIKFMFDFLDEQARLHKITDPDVVHIWKNNCLPLRFWVNLIKNPDILFDVQISNIVDSCLNVIAQVFTDSCSTSESMFNKDSATTKLLYAKEIPVYNKAVKKYYADIKSMPKVSLQDMNAMLSEESEKYATEFDTDLALYELSKYAIRYKEKLIDSLKNDESSEPNFLGCEFERTIAIMSAAEDL